MYKAHLHQLQVVKLDVMQKIGYITTESLADKN